MNGSWQTRAERNSGEQPAQPQSQPSAGQDLAALQRQRSRRQRASVAAKEQAERERRQQQLTRKAEREQDLSTLSRALRNRKLRRLLAGAAALAAIWFVAVPAVGALLDPDLSEQQLAGSRKPIDVAAARALGAQPGQPRVQVAAERFVLDYHVRSGARLFRGGRARGACSVRFAVDRARSEPDRLVFELLHLQRCRR